MGRSPRHHADYVLEVMREAMRNVPVEYRNAVADHIYVALSQAKMKRMKHDQKTKNTGPSKA